MAAVVTIRLAAVAAVSATNAADTATTTSVVASDEMVTVPSTGLSVVNACALRVEPAARFSVDVPPMPVGRMVTQVLVTGPVAVNDRTAPTAPFRMPHLPVTGTEIDPPAGIGVRVIRVSISRHGATVLIEYPRGAAAEAG